MGKEKTTEDHLEDEDTSSSLVDILTNRFESYKNSRTDIEAEWDLDYRNYMQEYKPEGSKSEGKGWRSRVFHPMTRTKINVAMSQIADIWFQGGKFPFDMKNSPVPDSPNEGLKELGFNLEKRKDRMRMKIKDQLIESKAKDELLACGLNTAIYGTGVMRAPFIKTKRRNRYVANFPEGFELPELPPEPNPKDYENLPQGEGEAMFVQAQEAHKAGKEEAQRLTKEHAIFELEEFTEIAPEVENIDPWDFFADPESLGDTQKMNGMFCRSFVTPAELYDMSMTVDEDGKNVFDKEAIEKIIEMNTKEFFDSSAGYHRQNIQSEDTQRHVVIIEYAGIVTKQDLMTHADFNIGEDVDDIDPVEVIVTFSRGHALRVELNEYPGKMRPYHMVQWERIPGRPYGRGLGRQLRDPQAVMNGFLRGYIDNKKLAGNLIFGISEDALAPGTDITLRPGKNFRFRAGVNIKEKFQVITIPDITGGLLDGMVRAEEWGDLASGLPKVLQGEAIRGANATAFEMNQRVTSAAKQIGLVLRYFDERIIEPMILSLYHWNMAQSDDVEIKGDFEIVPMGFTSFQNKALRSQALKGFLGLINEMPDLRSKYNVDAIVEEIAMADEVDLDKLKKTEDQLKADAVAAQEELKAQQEAQGKAMNEVKAMEQAKLDIEGKKIEVKSVEIETDSQDKELDRQHESQENEADRRNDIKKTLIDAENKDLERESREGMNYADKQEELREGSNDNVQEERKESGGDS